MKLYISILCSIKSVVLCVRCLILLEEISIFKGHNLGNNLATHSLSIGIFYPDEFSLSWYRSLQDIHQPFVSQSYQLTWTATASLTADSVNTRERQVTSARAMKSRLAPPAFTSKLKLSFAVFLWNYDRP